MATSGLYGSSPTGAVVAAPGAESAGLYGNTTNFGGTYFEWFVFQQSATAPATPTGGSWNFLTNTGTAPTGWTTAPPTNPTTTVWFSIAIVNSRDNTALAWTAPAPFVQQGPAGTAATVTAGTTTTGAAGTSASVTNSGTTSAAVFNFTIPRGDTGATGATGTAATVTAGTTTTGAAGTSASVTNSGTTSAAVFNFTIPRGDTGATGATGATGTAATIAVGTTTTGAPGTAASVTNSGTSSAATFNFTIPQGAGVPTGGTTGQVLAKASGANFDTTWLSITGGLSYQGSWNASTNTPTLTSSVGTNGYYYVVSVAGSTNLNGITDWVVGDWAIFNGSTWQKIDQTNLVTSVNGETGAVILDAADVGALATATSSDGSIAVTQVGTNIDLTVSASSPASTLLTEVRNTTGATLTKGTVVYISGATGQISTVSKAIASGDATSAQTLGMMTADLANNSNGYVTVFGLIENIDTSSYTDGAQLYLSGTVAGAVTATKPSAPTHLVYVAVVEYAHPTQGKLLVKVQNGYELDEIHDVQIVSPTTGQTLVYNSSTDLWNNSNAPVISGTTINNTTIGATTASTGAFTSLTATSGVISANSSSDALRITQIGAGNAILVEDSANPDSTPFVVDQSGQVIQGYTSAISSGVVATNPYFQMHGVLNGTTAIGLTNWSSTGGRTPSLNFNRSAGNAVNTRGALTVSGTSVGMVSFTGDDGTSWLETARIEGAIDGTPGTNDMPGRLVFSTTADGASIPTERMRIDNAGRVSIGSSSDAGTSLSLTKNLTGATGVSGVWLSTSVLSDATVNAFGFRTNIGTQAASFTLPSLLHVFANQGTIGAGSTVTNQFGFYANSTLTGATNNYGFYGAIASGTGRYNLYMAGTADNYLAGNVGIGALPSAAIPFYVVNTPNGSTSFGAAISPTFGSTTSTAYGLQLASGTQAAAFTCGNLINFNATQGTIGAGSTVTNQFGYRVDSTLTGATNNYGFYGNIASGTGRWNLYMAGTASNYFGGKTYQATNQELFIGGTTDATTPSLLSDGTYLQINAPAGTADIRFRVAGTERGRISSSGAWSLGGTVGAESLRVTPVASAVNRFTVLGGTTGNAPILYAEGSDTNIPVTFQTKGTGSYYIYGNGAYFYDNSSAPQFAVTSTASAVNYVQVTGGATGVAANITTQGSDANIGLGIVTKGTGQLFLQSSSTTAAFGIELAGNTSADRAVYIDFHASSGTDYDYRLLRSGGANNSVTYVNAGTGVHAFQTNAGTSQFNISHTASAVNAFTVTGGATGNAPTLYALGSDTDISINITPKGAGALRLTGSTSGYVGLKAAAAAGSTTYTLPSADGTSGQFLSTNGSGTLSWATGGGGGGGGSGTSTTRTAFTATAAQTTFTVSYVVGQIDVYMNGSKLLIGTDVTATSGTNIVLASGAAAGDIIEAVVYSSQWITSSTNLYYTAGNVGVGTTAPSVSFEVNKSSGEAVRVAATGANQNIYSRYIGGSPNVANLYVGVDSAAGGITGVGASGMMWQAGNAGLAFGTNNTLKMNINSAGQVGIGSTTASQADRLYVYNDAQSSIPTALIYKQSGGAGGSSIPEYGLDVYSGQMRNNTTAIYALRTRSDNASGLEGTTQYALYAEVTPRNNGSHYGAYIKGGHGNVDGVGQQTVAVIEGAVYGGTGTSGTITALRLHGTSNYAKFYGLQINSAYTGANTQTYQEFVRNNSTVGSITTSTTATAYNTSSDYRLKENVQPMIGALAKVQQLKPCTYTWKKDGSSGEGFIAHELAEVIPHAVTGEKDEVKVESYEVTPAVYRDITIPAVFDDNGNEVRPEQIEKEMVSPAVMGEREVPLYQGIDTSFLVATLTAAIQELKAIVDAQAAEIALLKGQVNG